MNAEMIGNKGMYPEFDDLRRKALDLNLIDEFFEAAQRELARLANEMILVRNTDKLLEGYHQSRMILVRALMAVQIDYLSYIQRNDPTDRKDS